MSVADKLPAISGSEKDQLQSPKQLKNMHIFDTKVPVSTTNASPEFRNLPVESPSKYTALQYIDPQMSPNAPPEFGNSAVKSLAQLHHTALQCTDPQMSWKQPCAVHFDPVWQVQAARASLQTRLQMQREALYPRLSSIPESPPEQMDIEPFDDIVTPKIPLEPLERTPREESSVHAHKKWNWNNKPDVQAAATAACAALSEYFKVDSEHFKQIVSITSLKQSLTFSKWPCAHHWIKTPYKFDMSLAAGGNEGLESKSSQCNISAVDGPHKTQGSEGEHLLQSALGNRHLFTHPTRVGLGQHPRRSERRDGPSGLGSRKANGEGNMPPNFYGKSPSHAGAQAGEAKTAAPLFMKPPKTCRFFGTARGCRNGDSCRFLHKVEDVMKNTQKLGTPAGQLREAKRQKVDS